MTGSERLPANELRVLVAMAHGLDPPSTEGLGEVVQRVVERVTEQNGAGTIETLEQVLRLEPTIDVDWTISRLLAADSAIDAAASTRLSALSPEELWPVTPTPIPWLVHDAPGEDGSVTGGLLAEQDTAAMGGDSGLGKTWIVAATTIGLAAQLPLFGHFSIARPCRVMVVDEESSLWLLQQRYPAVIRGYGLARSSFLEEVAPNLRLYRAQSFSFDDADALAALTDNALSFRPDLTIFDTYARVHGRAENDNSAIAGLFRERVHPFRRTVGCGVLFAHHTRKPDKMASNDAGAMLRGASDLRTQLDQFWFLRGQPNRPDVVFEHAKSRAGRTLPSFIVMRELLEDGGIRLVYKGGSEPQDASLLAQAKDSIHRFLIDNGSMSRHAVITFCQGQNIGQRTADAGLKGVVEDELVIKSTRGRETIYAPAPEAM